MKRFKNILVVAGDDTALDGLLSRATSLARRNDARLTILGVVDSTQTDRRVVLHDGEEFDVRRFLISTRRDELEDLASSITDVPVQVAVTSGTGFVEVIRCVLELGHDLVMVGADTNRRRMGLTGASLAMHLLRKCPVPVWVDSGNGELSADVAIAVGPFNEEPHHGSLNVTILELGTSLAATRHGVLHVVHAWRLEGESLLRRGRARPPAAEIDAMVEEAHQEAVTGLKHLMEYQPDMDVPTQVHLLKGEPGTVIPAVFSEHHPGVVVMGTLARAGLQGVFMGNTAERILGSIEGSVLAVKPEGFETPVSV